MYIALVRLKPVLHLYIVCLGCEKPTLYLRTTYHIIYETTFLMLMMIHMMIHTVIHIDAWSNAPQLRYYN
jgi:hypothetical protein